MAVLNVATRLNTPLSGSNFFIRANGHLLGGDDSSIISTSSPFLNERLGLSLFERAYNCCKNSCCHCRQKLLRIWHSRVHLEEADKFSLVNGLAGERRALPISMWPGVKASNSVAAPQIFVPLSVCITSHRPFRATQTS